MMVLDETSNVQIKVFFHLQTSTLTYVVFDKQTKDAVLFDPVLDYDQNSSTINHTAATELVNYILSENLNLHLIIETHVHADHLTASQLVKKKFPNSKIAISKQVTLVQKTFKEIYNLEQMATDGSQFDCLFEDGELVNAGSLKLNIMHTPGHTPACMSIIIANCLFTGDALFMPDVGTGRCDFPDGSSEDLYHSIHDKLYLLPDSTRVYVGHDYADGKRDLLWQTSIAASKRENIQLREETTKKEFIAFRSARDSSLASPKLLLPSIQVNIEAGHFPKAENNGTRYLKIPINERYTRSTSRC